MHLVLFKIWFVFSREWEILLFELFCRACIIYHATTWNGGLCYRISYMPAFCLPLFALETISLIDFFLNLTPLIMIDFMSLCIQSLHNNSCIHRFCSMLGKPPIMSHFFIVCWTSLFVTLDVSLFSFFKGIGGCVNAIFKCWCATNKFSIKKESWNGSSIIKTI